MSEDAEDLADVVDVVFLDIELMMKSRTPFRRSASSTVSPKSCCTCGKVKFW